MFARCLTLGVLALAASCSTIPRPPSDDAGDLHAEITRTTWGIPHIVASDYAGLGYGAGYAYAEDNFCMLAEKVNQINGERSRYFGGDGRVHIGVRESVTNRESDFFFLSQLPKGEISALYRNVSDEMKALTRGYVAGANRYLSERGIEGLPEPCRGAAWVRPLTEEDIHLWYSALATLLGMHSLAPAFVAAQPPAAGSAQLRVPAPAQARLNLTAMGNALAAPAESSIGSNAWAFGEELTTNGAGLLLGNPHWPWGNMNQFYQLHLTIPGEIDVMGVAAGGIPVVVIGFNDSIAWSHTVSTGARFVIRELQLVEGSPTSYVFDGQERMMTAKTISIDVLGQDGTMGTETRTFYHSHLGPIVVRPAMEWSTTRAFAFTDANLPNARLMDQWLDIGRSTSVGELRESLTSTLALPWVNTIAADRNGRALYADYSVKPYVTDEMLQRCAISETARRSTQNGTPVLDGSSSSCDPLTDPDAPQEGILPPHLLPVLERSDYVANSNNTYWLSNTAAPIQGLPTINGAAETLLSFRAQSGLRLIEEHRQGGGALAGNQFDRDVIKALVFGDLSHPGIGNHNRAADVVLESLEGFCGSDAAVQLDGVRVDISEACSVLSTWDRRADLTSRGEHLFREFWAAAQKPDIWAVAWEPKQPLETPRELRTDDPIVREALRRALAGAVLKLANAGIGMNEEWGRIHHHPVNGRSVPVRGSSSDVLNVIVAPTLDEDGYGPVVHGTSYTQIVGFEESGPVADAVLLFGQSTDAASPHYYDQLEQLWSEYRWHRLPFRTGEIEAQMIRRVTIEE